MSALAVNDHVKYNFIQNVNHTSCEEKFQEQIEEHFKDFKEEIQDAAFFFKLKEYVYETPDVLENFKEFNELCAIPDLNIDFRINDKTTAYLLSILMNYCLLYSIGLQLNGKLEMLNVSECSEMSPFCEGDTGFNQEVVEKLLEYIRKEKEKFKEMVKVEKKNLEKKGNQVDENLGDLNFESKFLRRINFKYTGEKTISQITAIKSKIKDHFKIF